MTTITISRNMLLSALLRLRHTFYRWDATPILQDYLFSIDGKNLTISSIGGYSSMGNYVKTEETLELPEGAIVYDGEKRLQWCIYRHSIVPALKALDEQDLIIHIGDYQLSVTHSCGKMWFRIDNASEYPSFPYYTDAANLMKLEAPGLANWINVLFHAIAEDELRPVMNGILVDCTPDSTTFVASDGHRLVTIEKKSIKIDKACAFIIPRRVVDIIRRVLPKTGCVDFAFCDGELPKARMEIEVEEGHMFRVYFFGVDGRYPSWRSVIPTTYRVMLQIDRKRMIKSLERLNLFAKNYSNLVKIDLPARSQLLEMYSLNEDEQLQAEENLPCEVKEGQNHALRWGMKIESLVASLKTLGTQNVMMRYIDPTRPVIILPEPQPDVEKITILLMPMLCND